MAEDERVATTREFLHRYFHGDIEAAAQLLSDNITYKIPGRHPLSGSFQGAEQVTQHLRDFKEFTGGTGEIIKWEDWLTGLNAVAAVAVLRAQQGNSLLIERVIFLASFASDGRIAEMEAFFSDEGSIDRFLSSRGV